MAATTWRRAIKKFSSRKINDADWQFLLDIARLAPSSYGLEPWNILDIQSPELREKLKPVLDFNAVKLDADHFVIFTVKNDLSANSKYFHKIMTEQNLPDTVQTGLVQNLSDFQNHSWDLTDDRKRYDWAAKQAYIAMAQMIFAAAEIGIDSCPMEGFSKTDLEKVLSDNGAINSATDSVVLCVAFGYRDSDPAFAKTRRNLDEIVKVV